MLAYKILLTVAKGTLVTAAIILALSGVGFHRRKRSYRSDRNEEKKREDLHRYYATLSRLKKQGMLVKRGMSWNITEKGRAYLIKMDESSSVWEIKTYPRIKNSGGKIIVAFDIPERFHSKRDALRGILAMLGFTMLQKSLWIGSNKIPEEFIEDLKEWKIIEYVHIFEVTKKGTLVE